MHAACIKLGTRCATPASPKETLCSYVLHPNLTQQAPDQNIGTRRVGSENELNLVIQGLLYTKPTSGISGNTTQTVSPQVTGVWRNKLELEHTVKANSNCWPGRTACKCAQTHLSTAEERGRADKSVNLTGCALRFVGMVRESWSLKTRLLVGLLSKGIYFREIKKTNESETRAQKAAWSKILIESEIQSIPQCNYC